MTKMEMVQGNIFKFSKKRIKGSESFETLLKSNSLLLEKILTHGELKSPGKWYDQEKDEWVMMVQGKATIEYDDGNRIEMKKGDYVIIPAHLKHRVIETSESPDCVWLALHGDFN
jgi:cupin 2 domain-containing protein